MMNVLINWNLQQIDSIRQLDHAGNPHVWLVNGNIVLKKYSADTMLEKQYDILRFLFAEGLPVAVPILTNADTFYAEDEGALYTLSPRLYGKPYRLTIDEGMYGNARMVGEAIGKLHLALSKYKRSGPLEDGNLYKLVSEWALPTLKKHELLRDMGMDNACEQKYLDGFSKLYDQMPYQLIHHDIHGDNILFTEGKLTGYVDFDISKKNCRIYDPCYFATGVLSGMRGADRACWTPILQSVLDGYDAVCPLSNAEKQGIPYVLYSIQTNCVAYFVEHGYDTLVEPNVNATKWLVEQLNI